MEVLGGISSLVSLLDVVIRSSNAVHSLITNWKDVPNEIVALENEITDSNAVFNHTRHLIRGVEDHESAGSTAHDHALTLKRHVDEAGPILNEIHNILTGFEDAKNRVNRISKPAKLRWLKCRPKIEGLRKKLRQTRNNIMEFLISSSAHNSHSIDMTLISISSNIKSSREFSEESFKYFRKRLEDMEYQMTLMSKNRERGAEEVSKFCANMQPTLQHALQVVPYSPKSDDSTIGSITHQKLRAIKYESFDSDNLSKTSIEPPADSDSLSSVGSGITYSSSICKFTFGQKISYCDAACRCACHSRNWRGQGNLGTSVLFKRIFGTLFTGYSSSPVPRVNCDLRACHSSPRGSTMKIQYSFPTWMAYRVITTLFSSHPVHGPSFALRISRRIPYVPGNIFSRINSKDFGGAITLLREGQANINDMEARHGISILGAALRSPAFGPGLIEFLEFLLQCQVDPYIQNDEGESAWHFAARLMFPNTSPAIASPQLQAQLHRLFPNPDWDLFQFNHIHKIVVGLRPINLARELENPKYSAQVNETDALGQTPLGLAAMLGDAQAVETLLLAGADPNPYKKSATTFHPLRKAVRAQSARSVELLLMASADPFSLDHRGASILHTAASRSNDLSLIRPLLLAGVPSDGRNVHDCTPLSFTPLKDNSEVARFLLSQGANINNLDQDGDTPLTESIRLNAHNCLKLFLREGANYQTISKRGWNILHFAAAFADMRTLEILLSAPLYGLDTELRDNRDQTPKDWFHKRYSQPEDLLEMFTNLLTSLSSNGKNSCARPQANTSTISEGNTPGNCLISRVVCSYNNRKAVMIQPSAFLRWLLFFAVLMMGMVVYLSSFGGRFLGELPATLPSSYLDTTRSGVWNYTLLISAYVN